MSQRPLPSSRRPIRFHIMAAAALLVGGLALARDVRPTDARCTSTAELSRFGRAANDELRCRAIGNPARSCRRDVPACAATARDQLLGLTTLDDRPQIHLSQAARRCHEEIITSTGRYVSTRISGRVAGYRPAPRATLLSRVELACAGARREGVDLTRLVGASCRIAARAPQPDSLGRCISARLEGIIDDAAPRSLPPNVVLILTDDQRWDTLGQMPLTIDRLSRRGLTFTHAFATTASCAPSRATILSGLEANRHGVFSGREILTSRHQFDFDGGLPAWVKEGGYRTALFGKYINSPSTLGETKPEAWDEWEIFLSDRGNYFDYPVNRDGVWTEFGSQPEDYSTDYMARRTTEFIRENTHRPFFVMYSPFAPHAEAIPAPRHDGALSDIPLHRPPNFRPPASPTRPAWLDFFRRRAMGPDRTDTFRQHQLETLLSVDEAIAEISDTLDRLGLTDNTVVLFLSDHGIHWGEMWWRSKFTSYDPSIRIPFILRYPRAFPEPGFVDAFVQTTDVAPTLAGLAGARVPDVQGANLLPVLRGEAPGRSFVRIENFDGFVTRPNKAIRTRRWKYIQTPTDAWAPEELYDLEVDPYELNNLIGDPDHEHTRTFLATLLEQE